MTDTSVAPVYVIHSEELVLDAPPAEAWPLVIDFPRWQSYSTVQTLEGVRGEVGEIVQLDKDEEGFEFPPYFARTLLVEPERRIIWKTFVDRDDEESPLFGIVEFRLAPHGDDKTLFSSSLIYQFKVPYTTEQDLVDFKADQEANFLTLVNSTHPKLVKLVAESRAN